jgi:oligopeptide transport system substrate-binding protein
MKYFFLGLLICAFISCNKVNPTRAHQMQNLRINLRKEPVSLDPRKGNDMVASQMHFMLFEGLLRLNSDMSLEMAQAESYEVSSDCKTYTFHLRNTLWSDGTPVTAYDFENAWKSIFDPNFASLDAYLLYAIKNARLAKSGEVSLDQVGIHATDAKTLVVELETPSPYFLQIVASSVLLPINKKMEKSDSNWANQPKHILSNGPFKLKSWKLNQEMVFEKNPLYHQANKVKLNHIFIDIIDKETAVLHMYASGYFDLVGTPLSFFPAALLDDLESRRLLTFFPVANTKFLAFNTSLPPFNNSNIRRAFAYAIDRKSIVKHITRLNQKEALNILPPVLLAEDSVYFADGDSAKAKQYLQEGLQQLQIENLGNLSFMYVSSESNHILAQALQHMWLKTLGVRVNLEHVEFKTLHERSKRGDFSIGLFAWVADYADSMSILERFTDKKNPRNYPKWENNTYNNIVQEALQTSSTSHYIEKIKEAERLLIDEMPITCLFHENYAFLIQPHVKGFEISPLGHIYFDKIYIAQTGL